MINLSSSLKSGRAANHRSPTSRHRTTRNGAIRRPSSHGDKISQPALLKVTLMCEVHSVELTIDRFLRSEMACLLFDPIDFTAEFQLIEISIEKLEKFYPKNHYIDRVVVMVTENKQQNHWLFPAFVNKSYAIGQSVFSAVISLKDTSTPFSLNSNQLQIKVNFDCQTVDSFISKPVNFLLLFLCVCVCVLFEPLTPLVNEPTLVDFLRKTPFWSQLVSNLKHKDDGPRRRSFARGSKAAIKLLIDWLIGWITFVKHFSISPVQHFDCLFRTQKTSTGIKFVCLSTWPQPAGQRTIDWQHQIEEKQSILWNQCSFRWE